MSTTPAMPEEPKPRDNAPLIDTSKMSEGQRAALELTEAARDEAAAKPSLASGLFMGRFDLDAVFPFPEQSGTLVYEPSKFQQPTRPFERPR